MIRWLTNTKILEKTAYELGNVTDIINQSNCDILVNSTFIFSLSHILMFKKIILLLITLELVTVPFRPYARIWYK